MVLPRDLTDEMVEELPEDELAELVVAGGVYTGRRPSRHRGAQGRVQDPPPS